MTKLTKEAQAKAWSPAARAKAAATRAKNREQKLLDAGQQANTPIEGIPDSGAHMSLDMIPDREPPKRGRPRKVKYEQGHYVTDDEWLFLQMAKRMLRGVK